jgi:hypothetical protein
MLRMSVAGLVFKVICLHAGPIALYSLAGPIPRSFIRSSERSSPPACAVDPEKCLKAIFLS